MVDNEQKINADPIVSNEEIENVTRDVLKKDEERRASEREVLEKEIRAKIAQEEEDKRQVEEKAALQAALVKKEKDSQAVIEKLKQELEDARKQVGGSKGVVNTQSPFQKNSNVSDDNTKVFSEKLSDEDLVDIDELSRQKWREYERDQI